MSDWKQVKLNSLIDFYNGFAFKSSVFQAQGIPVLKIKNVKPNRIILNELAYVSPLLAETKERYLARKDDILITMSGNRIDGSPDSWVGKVARFKLDGTYLINQRVSFMRVKETLADASFLGFYLSSWEMQNYFISKANSSGGQANISPDLVKDVDLSLPSLPEQKAIASVLSSLDDKIDLLHRQNKTLEAMAETLLIQHVLPREDEQNDGLYLLGDYLETISVTHKFPNPQVVFLNTSDIYKGKVLTHELSEVKGLPGQAKKSIKKGDILFSEIRPANGRYALIDFDADNYVVSTKLMVLRAKQPNLIGLLYFYLTNKQVTDWLQVLAESRSGTFPQITFDQVADLELRLPQGSDLNNLIGLLDDILLKQSANNKQIQTLENLRDTLLPKLMSGEVRVQYQTEEVA